MKLESITLKNYRSVKSVSFLFNQIKDKSFTYGLIGENEAGKSSILKGIAIKD
jgi:predicted ATP-dependent endonuclease of OLD family